MFEPNLDLSNDTMLFITWYTGVWNVWNALHTRVPIHELAHAGLGISRRAAKIKYHINLIDP